MKMKVDETFSKACLDTLMSKLLKQEGLVTLLLEPEPLVVSQA